jgi:diguanylate cyclase (GGDEF)-like protein
MNALGRFVLGPLVTLACVLTISLVNAYVVPIEFPAPIHLLAVVFAAYVGGVAPGLLSAAIVIFFTAIYFSPSGITLPLGAAATQRMALVTLVAPALAVMTSVLRSRFVLTLRGERQQRKAIQAAHKNLLTLRAALDRIEAGVVLLDREMRAVFINEAFRRMWRLPDEKANAKPAFVGLMYHGRDTNAYAVPARELDAYIGKRVASVQAGDAAPIDIRLANGDILRVQCSVLPDGGRMLVYNDVTDLVLQAERMEKLANIDGLTGLFNRRHFLSLADTEWSRHRRYGRPLSLLLLDIDHFKTVNDRFGHDVGDQAIFHVANLCQESKRQPDILARLGGEEFAMLLPETKLEDAHTVAERLRSELEAEPLLLETGEAVAVTVSIGVAQADLESGLGQLMKNADNRLYEAKQAGRNCVMPPPQNRRAPAHAA